MAKIQTGIDAPAVPISYELGGVVFLINAAFVAPDQGRGGVIFSCLVFIVTGLIF